MAEDAKRSKGEGTPAPEGDAPKARPRFWRSPAVIVGVIVTLLGAGAWAVAAATRPDAPEPVAAGAAADSDAGSAFAPRGLLPTDPADGSAGGAGAEGDPGLTDAQRRLIDDASPAVAVGGLSFVGGFALGFALRQFVKIGLLVIGLGIAGLIALEQFGVVSIHWSGLSGAIDGAIGWARAQSESLRTFLLGQIPTAGAGGVGLVLGFRKR